MVFDPRLICSQFKRTNALSSDWEGGPTSWIIRLTHLDMKKRFQDAQDVLGKSSICNLDLRFDERASGYFHAVAEDGGIPAANRSTTSQDR